jgi:predicted nucleic acid-binding protein
VILIDSGALVAIVDRGSPHHEACVRVLKDLTEPLASVWAVLGDAIEALRDLPKGQDVVWEMVERGAVQIIPLDESDVPAVRDLMTQHAERRIRLADAALVRVADRESLRTLFTVRGKDFSMYKPGGRRLKVIP